MLKLAAAALLGLSLAGTHADNPAAEGRRAAEADLRAGRLILRSYGFVASGNPDYARLLLDRLGVRTKAVAGCVVDATIVAQTAAYNEVMKAAIRKRFGAHIFEDLAAEAARLKAPPPR
jgi:hypothetical protein